MDNISIIIRTRNEEEYVGFAIQSCLDHFDQPEIIIIDNYSIDDTLQIVDLFSDRTNIKVKTIEQYTPGKSINMGVKEASNDYILVMSAHTQLINIDFNAVKNVFHREYLFEDKNEYILSTKDHVVAVMGNQIPVYKGKKISKRYIWEHFHDEGQHEFDMFSKAENRFFLHNAFCFYEKKTLEQYPMPEDIPGKEDRYWINDMVDKQDKHFVYATYQKANHFYTKNGATWKGIG